MVIRRGGNGATTLFARRNGNARPKKSHRTVIIIVVLVSVCAVVIILAVVAAVVVSRRTQLNKRSQLKRFPHSPIVWQEKDRAKLKRKCEKDGRLEKSTIFVAIASYRDNELTHTVKDLREKAYNPARISVGIVQQNAADDSPDCRITVSSDSSVEQPWQPMKIQTIDIPLTEASGPTFARSVCESLWRGQDYYLLIDSHMKFEPGWDVDLLDMLLHKCKRPHRTVITMYPQGWDRWENPTTKDVHMKVDYRRGWRYEQLKGFNADGIIEFESFTSYLPPPKHCKPVPMFAACFAFGHSDMLRLVPYHPNTPHLFFGEEMFMAARLYTHGFDLVGPTHSVLYHLWDRTYRKTYFGSLDENKRRRSVEKIKDIMTGRRKDPKYGLGNKRTIDQFFNYLGVDFERREFTRPHKPWRPPRDHIASGEREEDEFVMSSKHSR